MKIIIDTQETFEKGRRDGFEDGFSHCSKAVFEYLSMAMPHHNDLQAQHFHMGLVSHLRFVFLIVSL